MGDAAGSLTGSPEAGASSHQEAEEKQDEEVEVEVVVVGSADGGASQPVRTKAPTPIFDQHGAEYSVPQVTVDAIESYVVPPKQRIPRPKKVVGCLELTEIDTDLISRMD